MLDAFGGSWLAIPFLLLGTVLLATWAVRRPRRGQAPLPVRQMVVSAPDGSVRGVVLAEIAMTLRQQEIGLMFRVVLAEGRGMYFPMRQRWFWPMTMRNTGIALDIVHLDRGVVVSVSEGVPMSRRVVGGACRSTAVLELSRGWCRAHGVEIGDSVGFLSGARQVEPEEAEGRRVAAVLPAVVLVAMASIVGLASVVPARAGSDTGSWSVSSKDVSETRFVTALSRIAGAESVCRPRAAPALRQCGEFVVAHWSDVTGKVQASPAEMAAYPVIWSHGVGMAAQVQRDGRGMPCDRLASVLLRSGLLGYCPVVSPLLR